MKESINQLKQFEMKVNQLFCLMAMVMVMFTSCEKEGEEDEPILPPAIPELSSPINNSVKSSESVKVNFSWIQSESGVSYSIYLSEDQENWNGFTVGSKSYVQLPKESEYTFESGKTYYWKVIATRLDDNGDKTDLTTESEIFNFTIDVSSVTSLICKSSSYTYWPENYDGKAFADLIWEDSPNIEYVEISFEPAVEGIQQPIKVEAGIQTCRIEGFDGYGSIAGSPEAQVYDFTVKAYGIDDLVSSEVSVKAQPLTHNFVHDADFNTYIPTLVGDQVWLSTNLRTTHFNNGEEIGDDIIESYGWSDGEHEYNEMIYKIGLEGLRTIRDNDGMCPEGFHISSHEDWDRLEAYFEIPDHGYGIFGVEQKFGKMLKAESGWGIKSDGTSANGTGVLNFNAVPSSYGFEDGFSDDEYQCPVTTFYCYNESLLTDGVGGVYGRVFLADTVAVYQDFTATGVIRCVKDAE